jgi:CDP-diacylglycerol--glycerol-3-phosphate 3-phosphatidyltransferase
MKEEIKRKEPFWTLPNIITLYRILIFPYILFLIISGRQYLFSIFITISLVTDILDGLIARTFKLQTRTGALLDSWADTGTYILAFLAIYIFKWTDIRSHVFLFFVFLGILILSYLLVFVKFKALIGLHTYLFKITGYVQGAFIVVLFLSGFKIWLFYIALCIGILACLEEIAIILLLNRPLSNVKSLYWLLKSGTV